MKTDTTLNTQRPNVIWIIGDQHRSQALGCNGDPNINTPNIDRLAATGANFTGAVGGYPLCCPFRGSMLTSRYPHNCVNGHQYQMPPEYPTIASVFNQEGYDTAYFGKWHLDGCDENVTSTAKHIIPRDRRGSFRNWLGYENNNSQWDCWVHGHDAKGKEIEIYRLPGYETDELTSLFVDYIKDKGRGLQEGKDEPFFAVLSVQPPHDPNVAHQEYMGKHNPAKIKFRNNVPDVKHITERAGRELAGYYAQIENLDYNVGRVIEALYEVGLAYDTHIIYFSDHGDMHGSHGQFRKVTPYEEAIRVPFIISGEKPNPYNFEGRKTGRFNVAINHVDIAPTTLGLCGIKKPEWMKGTDYSHYRLEHRSQDNEPDSAYIQSSMLINSVNPTPQPYMVDRPWRGIVTNDGWKYVCFEGIPWLMFNLNEDPYEQVNLAHNQLYAKKRKEFNDKLSQWVKDTSDEFILPDY